MFPGGALLLAAAEPPPEPPLEPPLEPPADPPVLALVPPEPELPLE